ncbi:phage protein [Streptococcus pseudoporcinus]|uniref:Phage protein n=1 Tax=Streptococcus pseudoporcinus TaxID=361101 RepID=A0A4U9XN64_9STRE|nr:hypothetical protein [Streptococcus pseudoporcinus]VTS14148.1 phage protein [Streptococcus pseudoporcinus]
MGKIHGIQITLIDKQVVSVDPFGTPVIKDVKVLVDNVLVSPSSTDDVTNQLSLTGKKAVYTLAIPKGDLHDWENKEVIFFGQKWRTVGFATEGIEDLIPLEWNKKVMVERYE